MRWSGILFLFLLLASPAIAVDIVPTCPTDPVPVNTNFDITVAYTGATRVGLHHHGAWDNRSGSSVTYTIQEGTANRLRYYVNAEVGGQWLSEGDDFCYVTIIVPADQAGDVTLTTNASSIVAGGSVLMTAKYADPDGTSSLRILDDDGSRLESRTCSGGTCTLTYVATPTATMTYEARGYDTNGKTTEDTARITVSDTPPTVSMTASKTTIVAGESVTFSGSLVDNFVIPTASVAYGDGVTESIICSLRTCAVSKSHVYATSGSYAAVISATDTAGQKKTQSITITVTAPTDADGDSVPDASDTCPSTSPGEAAVTSGSYLGCSCNQIVNIKPNPADDGLPCTEDYCSISGSYSAQHPPKPDGAVPAGYSPGCIGTTWNEYSCQGGQVITSAVPDDSRCITCTPDASRSCWDNNVHSFDSCGNRNPVPVDTCTPAKYCQDGSCHPYTLALYRYETSEHVSSITATQGTNVNIRPQLLPASTATYTMRGSATVIGDYASIPVSGSINSTITSEFFAKINGVTVATQTLNIKITCNKGEPCYCDETTITAGCITDGTQVSTNPGYCTLGLCGTCPANTLFSNGKCVECTPTDTTRCTADQYCQTATCNDGACQVSNKNDGTSCGTAGVCNAGACKGCSHNSCTPTKTTKQTTTTSECKETTNTIEITTAGICNTNTCIPGTSTETTISTTTKNLTGTPCSKGTCDNGQCTETTCYELKTNPNIINWEANHTTCNGQVTLCNQT